MNFMFFNCRMEKINEEKIIAVTVATYAAVAGKKGRKIHAGRDSNPDFCITGAALELQANWELVMEMK